MDDWGNGSAEYGTTITKNLGQVSSIAQGSRSTGPYSAFHIKDPWRSSWSDRPICTETKQVRQLWRLMHTCKWIRYWTFVFSVNQWHLGNVWKMQTSELCFDGMQSTLHSSMSWDLVAFSCVEWPGQWCSGHCPVSRSQRRPGRLKDIHCNDFEDFVFQMQMHLEKPLTSPSFQYWWHLNLNTSMGKSVKPQTHKQAFLPKSHYTRTGFDHQGLVQPWALEAKCLPKSKGVLIAWIVFEFKNTDPSHLPVCVQKLLPIIAIMQSKQVFLYTECQVNLSVWRKNLPQWIGMFVETLFEGSNGNGTAVL